MNFLDQSCQKIDCFVGAVFWFITCVNKRYIDFKMPVMTRSPSSDYTLSSISRSSATPTKHVVRTITTRSMTREKYYSSKRNEFTHLLKLNIAAVTVDEKHNTFYNLIYAISTLPNISHFIKSSPLFVTDLIGQFYAVVCDTSYKYNIRTAIQKIIQRL